MSVEAEANAPQKQNAPLSPSLFRRDIKISNVVLNIEDLGRLFQIIDEINRDARLLQVEFEDVSKFDSEHKLRELLSEVMILDYTVRYTEASSVSGRGSPGSAKLEFDETVESIFVSNVTSYRNISNGRTPSNAIDVFIDLKAPSLAINFLSLPSNPTENGSIINIYGLNEAWVVTSHEKLVKFFSKRKSYRELLHGSGVYDAFLYFIYIPAMLWILYKIEIAAPYLFDGKFQSSIIAIYIYSLGLALLLGRVFFQYFRWLFPPVELDVPRLASRIHRGFVIAVSLSFFGAVIYDIFKSLF